MPLLPLPPFRVVLSAPELASFLASFRPRSSALYLKGLGNKLGKSDGTLALLTVLVHPTAPTTGQPTDTTSPALPTPAIIDLNALGSAAFTTPIPSLHAAATTVRPDETQTLGSLLQNPRVLKYLWGLTPDVVALQQHHGQSLAGAIDLQLLERAAWPDGGAQNTLSGLDQRVKQDLGLDPAECKSWANAKKVVRKKLWQRWLVNRPLRDEVASYCAGDVMYMPRLRDLYGARVNEERWESVVKES
ncbi:hypothetical protein C8A05DRAFT_20512, partial [Staphylotrichum tortipilum]